MVQKKFNEDERLYLSMLDNNISRMNTNSMNCKVLMTAMVAGILALLTNDGVSEKILFIAMAITVLSYVLDCYYLMLEKDFRDIEKAFLNATEENRSKLLFVFTKKEGYSDVVSTKMNFLKSLISKSTCILYGSVEIALLIIWYYFY